jgi:uncharacterized protein YwqG
MSELNLDAIAAKLKPHVLPAAVGRLKKRKQDLSSPTSCYGGTFWGRRGEAWPECNGRPMIPLVQVRCEEVPVKRPGLKRIALLTVFIDEDVEADVSTDADASLVVRQYARLSSLRPLEPPSEVKRYKHSRIEWKKVDDYPGGSDMREILTPDEWKLVRELKRGGENPFTHHPGIKIGGWPTPVQVSVAEDESYTMQIDSDYNYMFGDSGILYLFRSDDPHWDARWECL